MDYYHFVDIYLKNLQKKLNLEVEENNQNKTSRIVMLEKIKKTITDKKIDDSTKKLIKKIHYFKKTDLATLPRVVEIIKIIRGFAYEIESLVDFGSQRGALLFPLMNQFPQFKYTGIDLDDEVKDFYDCLELLPNFQFVQANLEDLTNKFDDKSIDVVIASEIFEHIVNYQSAIDEAFRIARKYIIVTVPNHPDDNPEHINYFTKEDLENFFNRPEKGVTSCKITSGRIYNLAKISLDY